MSLLTTLRTEAITRGHLNPEDKIDTARAFELVRDMAYMRASNRNPETTIREWRGTCSGKHYLLKALFAELGISSRLIACATRAYIDPKSVPQELGTILLRSDGQFVDVHNYLILELPEGEMIVDATWPLSTKEAGLAINETFKVGEDHKLACPPPIKTWVVPEDEDPQTFKEKLLVENFTPEELTNRDVVIKVMGELLSE